MDDAKQEFDSPPDSDKTTTVFRKVRNELAFELAFVVLCFVLAIGLNFKVVLAVALTCLKFAIQDFVTAYLVVKNDSSRAHGVGVAFLFLATGMARASQFAFIALFFSACLILPFIPGMAWRKLFAIGLGTGFVCAFGFLAFVFPLTLIAVLIAKKANIELWFASELTKLRRSSDAKRAKIKLQISRSVGILSMVSGISLAVCLIGLLFLMPQQGVVLDLALILLLGAFALPIPWIITMIKIIIPPDEELKIEPN